MKTAPLRRWNNVIHRDLGYLCVGMTIIYALSGIVLNHFKAGHFSHPDYRTETILVDEKIPSNKSEITKDVVLNLLDKYYEKENFSKYFATDSYLTVFVDNGTFSIDLATGKGTFEKKIRRHVFKEFNFLHYNNPKSWWTWFSDLYAVSLIMLAITGLFVLRGKKGILGRGAWLTAIGVIVPAIFLFFYL